MTRDKPLFRARRVSLVWVSHYHDGPLSGLCRANGHLMRFERAEDASRYRVFSLSTRQKVKWLLHKAMFEACVGKHWSYPNRANGEMFHLRRPAWIHKLLISAYYKLRSFNAFKETP